MAGLARYLSKLGVCSRSEAARRVLAGRVRLDGRLCRDPETAVASGSRVEMDGQPVAAVERVYLMLNKPRGLVTSASDERGRDTVYRCLEGHALPWVAPVGRLDRASEGLLLLGNDPQWAAGITDPAQAIVKTYHVQIDCLADEVLLARLRAGAFDAGEALHVRRVELLRSGSRHAWLEVLLEEGRNRHIRRLLAAHGVGVLRLVRVAIGALTLGDLPKGQLRRLDAGDLAKIRTPAGASRQPARRP